MHLAMSRPRLMPLLCEPERMNGTPNLVWVTGFPPASGWCPSVVRTGAAFGGGGFVRGVFAQLTPGTTGN